MKNAMACVAVFALVGAAVAAPEARDVVVTTGDDGLVRVDYSLTEKAIVCFDVTTNGVSVGGRNLWRVLGDVNRVVGRGHDFATPYVGSFTWFAAGTELACAGLPDAAALMVEVKAYALDNPPDYLAVNLPLVTSGAATAVAGDPGFGVRFYPDEASLPGGLLENPAYRETILLLRRIHAKGVTWRRGAPNDGTWPERNGDELNAYVQLTNDFYLGVFRLTRHQWTFIRANYSDSAVRANYPTAGAFRRVGGGNCRVTDLRGDAANSSAVLAEPSAASWLGTLRSQTQLAFDVPTSLEWEYACRAGTKGPLYNSDAWSLDCLDEIAWTKTNADGIEHETGLKVPNAWGLHDMIGGAHELCRDLYVDGPQFFALLDGKGGSADAPALNPVCLVGTDASVTNRIRVGGARGEDPKKCRVTMRMSLPADQWWAAVRLACPTDAWWL